MYRRLGGTQRISGWVRKISPPPGFDPRTVEPLASRYTDYNPFLLGLKVVQCTTEGVKQGVVLGQSTHHRCSKEGAEVSEARCFKSPEPHKAFNNRRQKTGITCVAKNTHRQVIRHRRWLATKKTEYLYVRTVRCV